MLGTARSLAAFDAWLLAGALARNGAPLIRPTVLALLVTQQTSGIGNRAPTKLVTRFAPIGSGLRAVCGN